MAGLLVAGFYAGPVRLGLTGRPMGQFFDMIAE
jgi:hypothetical protein